ncbi:hypothetical protein MJO28_000941 [Puccinia striiformis f. sp. tritici]|uniref:Velvet domain-containing protein n=3 Tax=Puccinia striiformis TaxID=27350 RepID=A0A2S4W6E0_9BASI|nr:hypothetical protein Pst134EA_000309 [Puccinia striiformis f. sp. tritici]KAH9473236.1 hypothetical protein Pst134EA_000309 [Puccinia striiformis f. sp. tritici]KAI7962847.1 hypothetical protein MJO28_000941 [Puccinia striiformis f. sp. tritici]KAI9601451.1 hypothetical protein H4Q26_001270 [Puccinia striiformis f. sp. tritici PST-130]POW17331.1 hypothetical protein PSTT_00633 [Puccinia striiformis]
MDWYKTISAEVRRTHGTIKRPKSPGPSSAMSIDTHMSPAAGGSSSANELSYRRGSVHINRASVRQENTYFLNVVQQPRQVRLYGNEEQADRRRTIQPEHVLKFSMSPLSNKTLKSVDATLRGSPYFVCYSTLCEAQAPYEEIYAIPHSDEPSLVGGMVASMFYLKNGKDGISEGYYFVFYNLGIRVEGIYRLKYTVYEFVDRRLHHCQSAMSETIQVFATNDFPAGLNPSTKISSFLSSESLKTRVRAKGLNVPVLGANFRMPPTVHARATNRNSIENSENIMPTTNLARQSGSSSGSQPPFNTRPAPIKSSCLPEPRPSGSRNKSGVSLPSLTKMLDFQFNSSPQSQHFPGRSLNR